MPRPISMHTRMNIILTLSRLLAGTLFAALVVLGRAAEPAEQIPPVVIPNFKLLVALFNDMARGETPEKTRTARDKLAAYASDLSHDEKSRAIAIDFLSSVKSEQNLKLLASFFTDPSGNVRTRAFYGMPEALQSKIGDYDYTRPHSKEEFRHESMRINQLIEAYIATTKK